MFDESYNLSEAEFPHRLNRDESGDTSNLTLGLLGGSEDKIHVKSLLSIIQLLRTPLMENLKTYLLCRQYFLLSKTATVSNSCHILSENFDFWTVQSLPYQEPESWRYVWPLNTFRAPFHRKWSEIKQLKLEKRLGTEEERCRANRPVLKFFSVSNIAIKILWLQWMR